MKTPDRPAILICGVITSQLSLARYYGGIRIDGIEYCYHPDRDILLRKDWDKFYSRVEWNTLLEAIQTGIKPTIPKRMKTKPEKDNTIKTLFD